MQIKCRLRVPITTDSSFRPKRKNLDNWLEIDFVDGAIDISFDWATSVSVDHIWVNTFDRRGVFLYTDAEFSSSQLQKYGFEFQAGDFTVEGI